MRLAYNIALFGTNQYYALDDNSEIDLTSLGVTNPMASWLIVKVDGISPAFASIDDIKVLNSGIAVHKGKQAYEFDIKVQSFKFPDDMKAATDLAAELRHKYLFLYQGDYPSASDWSLHSSGKALGVALSINTEHDYPNGVKEITLRGRAVMPRRV